MHVFFCTCKVEKSFLFFLDESAAIFSEWQNREWQGQLSLGCTQSQTQSQTTILVTQET
jgi:hypothetical protein